MKLAVSRVTQHRMKHVAALRQTTPDALAEKWLTERLDLEKAPQMEATRTAPGSGRKCLLPSCPRFNYVRGLCAKHYARARYLLQAGMSESFLVTFHRIRPAKGKTITDYVCPDEGPGDPPSPDPETLWFFCRGKGSAS